MHCLTIEDDPINILGLNVLFRNQLPTWKLTTAMTVSDAIRCMQSDDKRTIDLIVLNLAVPSEDQAVLFTFLNQNTLRKPTRCIVMSGSNDQQVIARYKGYGIAGYILKNMALKQQIKVLKIICNGGEYFPSGEEATDILSSHHQDPKPVRLTARQRDLIRLIFAGYSNKKIAAALGLSYGTVKNYMFDLMRLLSVNSRLELTVKLRENIDMLMASTDTVAL